MGSWWSSLGLMVFAVVAAWVLGLWVLFAALSSASLSSTQGEASLSQV